MFGDKPLNQVIHNLVHTTHLYVSLEFFQLSSNNRLSQKLKPLE
jgi:hypothetical protein